MSISVYISGAIMLAFMLVAMGWSMGRVWRGPAVWRVVHSLIVFSMIAGGICVYMNQGTYGVLAGITLLATSMAAMLMDKSTGRWLAMIEFITGGILASGVLFGAS